MKKLFEILIIIALLFVQSCKDENVQLIFDVDITFQHLIYYPNDSISMTFLMSSSGGESPYAYNWVNPDTLVGEGPFTIDISNDILLELEVIDANNTKVEFNYEIFKDTIERLKYDYRNNFMGFYDCVVLNQWVEELSDTMIIHLSTSQETIEVIKHDDFQKIKIINWFSEMNPNFWLCDLDFNFNDSTFNGYHTYGRFHADSIMFYYYSTPVALSSSDYKGVKIK